jgi:hypothetical protein
MTIFEGMGRFTASVCVRRRHIGRRDGFASRAWRERSGMFLERVSRPPAPPRRMGHLGPERQPQLPTYRTAVIAVKDSFYVVPIRFEDTERRRGLM